METSLPAELPCSLRGLVIPAVATSLVALAIATSLVAPVNEVVCWYSGLSKLSVRGSGTSNGRLLRDCLS